MQLACACATTVAFLRVVAITLFYLKAGPVAAAHGQADELEGATQLPQNQLEILGMQALQHRGPVKARFAC